MSDIGMRSNEELGLLIREKRTSEMELNMFRSGSTPPTVEGSLNVVNGLFESGVCEDELRSDPAYVNYYYANVNLNLRLPTSLVSKEDWRFSQRLSGGGSGGGSVIGDRRKVNGKGLGGGGRVEWGENGLIGLPWLGLGSRQKSIAEIIQVDAFF
ncbi:hypothetical protein Tco_1304789 [Tanacetum coccineum]